MLRYSLYTLNRGNEPTFATCNRREVIDITICNSICYELIRDWKVSDEVTLSDHRLICFSIAGTLTNVIAGRNRRKTNWDFYKKDLQDLYEGM